MDAQAVEADDGKPRQPPARPILVLRVAPDEHDGLSRRMAPCPVAGAVASEGPDPLRSEFRACGVDLSIYRTRDRSWDEDVEARSSLVPLDATHVGQGA